MKLRKIIPTVVAVLLALVLSVGLFSAVIPTISAEEEPTPGPLGWNRTQSGYTYGLDGSIYSYACSMNLETKLDELSGEVYDDVTAILDIYNEAADISAPINKSNIVLTGLVYYPELDEYETVVHTNYRSGLQNVNYSDMNILAAMKDFGGVWYYGEILYVKAEYYLNDRMIESLSWYREE